MILFLGSGVFCEDFLIKKYEFNFQEKDINSFHINKGEYRNPVPAFIIFG